MQWTFLAHCIAVVWRWLSQVDIESGRLHAMCPSVPIIAGGEGLVLWAPGPWGPLSPFPPRQKGLY